MNLSDLKNKKIAILGFGVEGNAVADFLSANNISFDVLDQKNGENYLDNLKSYDILFRSPGIKLLEPKIVQAADAEVKITSATKFFFDNCPAKIIGVTGTKGKGTTSKLIYEILKAAGAGVYLGGNIGNPVLDLIGKLKPEDFVVLELSSFQLQDLKKSPHIAVVLMTTSEHLDYHKDTEEYIQAKFAIAEFQNEKDYAVINADFQGSRDIGRRGNAKKYYFSTVSGKTHEITDGAIADKDSQKISLVNSGNVQEFMDILDTGLVGYHNVQNVCAAILAAKIAAIEFPDINDQLIKQIVQNFKGLPHRLEFVAEKRGIKFYNDSFGTTPETCIVAVQAFSDPEIVIVGGFNKNGEYAELAKNLSAQKNIKVLILIGQIAGKLEAALRSQNFSGKILIGAKNMPEVFDQIKSVAEAGDLVLLAPATSSFDWYENYKVRGDDFKKLVGEFE